MSSPTDGKGAKTDRVVFTMPAAQRISRVVRIVEAGSRTATPLRFERTGGGRKINLSLATFTGNWEKGTYKTVTLHESTNTAEVYNWCNSALGGDTSSTTQSRYVIFGNANGRQSAVEIQMATTQCTSTLVLGSIDVKALPGWVPNETQLLGHGAASTASTCSGGLQWFSITTCATATA